MFILHTVADATQKLSIVGEVITPSGDWSAWSAAVNLVELNN